MRAEAMSELAAALAQAQQYHEAERVIASIEDSLRRELAMSALAAALAQAQQWEQAHAVLAEAEQDIATIEHSNNRASALGNLATLLININEPLQLLRLVQHSWQQADTREYAIALLPLANGILSLSPRLVLSYPNRFLG